MKKSLSFLGVCFLVTACLTQTNPTPELQKGIYAMGVASLEGLVASNQGELTLFTARFQAEAEKTKPVSISLKTAESRRQVAHAFSSSARRPDCQKIQATKQTAKSAGETMYLDMGKIALGPILQSSLMVFEPNEKNIYSAVLNPDFPPGGYQLITEGKGKTPKIVEFMSLPEQVDYLRINGRDFGDPTIDFAPSETLKLFWREPSVANDHNRIFLEIRASDESKEVGVFCALEEAGIPASSGFKEWNLDSAWFNEFPTSGKAEFYFVRAHTYLSGARQPYEMSLSGLRTYYSRLPLK